MSAPPGAPGADPTPDDPQKRQELAEEPEHQREHRQFGELLQEMRVALPGVQVLFAFLLTVPFQQRFTSVGSFGRATYLIALLLATLSSGLLIGPSAYHRVRFGHHDLRHTVRISHRMAIAGLVCLALAIASAVMTACSMLASHGVAAAIGAGVLAILVTIWFVLPIAHGLRERRHPGPA